MSFNRCLKYRRFSCYQSLHLLNSLTHGGPRGRKRWSSAHAHTKRLHNALFTCSTSPPLSRMPLYSLTPLLISKYQVRCWHPSLVAVPIVLMSQTQTFAFVTSVRSLHSNSLFTLVNTLSDFNYHLTDGFDYTKWGSWNPNCLYPLKQNVFFLQIEP